MATLMLGRLALGPPSAAVAEPVGDPIGAVGAATVPTARAPLQVQFDLNTIVSGASTLANAQTVRRQLRALLGNTLMKMQCFIYINYADDSEQNGWLIPPPLTLSSPDGTAWRAVGLWATGSAGWNLAGRRRGFREARSIWMKDLRTGLFERDQLLYVLSSDFSLLPALQLTYLPNGATQIAQTVADAVPTSLAMPTGRDGGTCRLVQGLADLSTVSYERTEAALNLSDVIVYDRRGKLGPFGISWVDNVAQDSPTVWYRLDETAGLTLVDHQARFNGTYTASGVTYRAAGATADGGTAITLDGVNGSASVPYNAALNPAQFSIEFWCNPVNANLSQNVLACLTAAGATGYVVWIQGALLNFGVATSGGGLQSLGVAVSSGVWTHFVCTWDGAVLTIYKNGVPSTGVPGFPFAPNTTAALSIGIDPSGVHAGKFNGTLDEVAFYSTVLSAGQALAHYNYTSPTYAAYDSVAGLANPQAAYGWEEAPGTDFAWSWIDAGGTQDCPVIENGLVRVRYDATNTPGFRVDVWNGSTWLEQGKVLVLRRADSIGYMNTWVSASLYEYTPDRAVIMAVLANSADPYSRERVFITLQRGEVAVEFELYLALNALLQPVDGNLEWWPAPSGVADLNNSIVKVDSQGSVPLPNWVPGLAGTAAVAGTAGTGAGAGNSGLWGGGIVLGNPNFTTSENWVSLLRCPTGYSVVGPYQTNLAVVQAAGVTFSYEANSFPYGVNQDGYSLESLSQQGYLQLLIGFAPTLSAQVLEAESMAPGSGTTNTVDAAASGGHAATATRTTNANVHAFSFGAWPGYAAVYRMAARAKVSANSGSLYVSGAGFPTVSASGVPGTGTDDAAVGSVAWTNPGNVITGNSSTPATAAVGSSAITHYIKATNFGFAIPSNVVVRGIIAQVYRFCASGFMKDSSVKSVKAGVVGGTDHVGAGAAWTVSPQPGPSYGGQADLWGQTWLPSDINSSGFGVAVSGVATGGADTAKVFAATIVVYYTTASAVVAVAATSYTWYDLGEVPGSAANQLFLNAWMSGGAGTISVDRLEAHLVQDRLANTAIFAGARDLGQAALMDSRTLGTLVAR